MKLIIPFKPSALAKGEAKQAVCASYWRQREMESKRILRDPKIIAALKLLGMIK